MFRNIKFITAICAVALSGTALAQSNQVPPGSTSVARTEVPVQARMSMHVSALVLEDLRQIVPDEDKLGPMFLRMVLLSKQEAIGASCDAYTLDQKRMVAVMFRTIGELIKDQDTDKDKDAARDTLNRVLRQYSTLLGGELAQFGYDPTGFCESGKDLYKGLSEYPETIHR